MEVDYRKYQYHIATPPFDENHPINSKIVPYWKHFWKKILSDINSNENLQEDELHWQNRITYITKDQNIVGIHFIANYKASEFAHSNYAQRYLPLNIDNLLPKAPNSRVNTLQYLSVDSKYRYRQTGIDFASVLADISTLQHNELNAKRTVSVIRKSVGMHNMARKVGFQELCKSRKHNVDVSIMYNDIPTRHPKKSVTKVSDYLWANRFFSKKEEISL